MVLLTTNICLLLPCPCSLDTTMNKRVQQHKKDVEYGRTGNSAIARHTEQFKHKIDWSNTECLETEKKVISTQNYRKCVHKGQQEQVHEPK